MADAIERVTDLDAAFGDLCALFEELHDYHMPMWPRDFLPDWRETWRDHTQLGDDRLILLASDGGEPLGFMAAAIRRDPSLFRETYCQLEDAYVRPAARRLGLGSALLDRLEAWSRERAVAEIRLGAVVANEIGVAFWTKSGFAPLTYTMSKQLSGVDA